MVFEVLGLLVWVFFFEPVVLSASLVTACEDHLSTQFPKPTPCLWVTQPSLGYKKPKSLHGWVIFPVSTPLKALLR